MNGTQAGRRRPGGAPHREQAGGAPRQRATEHPPMIDDHEWRGNFAVGRLTKSQTEQLREQLFDVLASATTPMATDDLASAAPWHVHVVRSRCGSTHPSDRTTPWNVVECRGDWHVIERPRNGHDIYPHLRRLERQDRIARHQIAGDRKVYWVVARNQAAQSDVPNLDSLQAAS